MKQFKLYLVLIVFFFGIYLNDLDAQAEDYNSINAGFTSFMQEVDVEPLQYDQYEIAPYSGFKSYMTYTLFGTKTNQYKLQTICTTDSDGFRRVDDKYYVIALGTRFKCSIGQRVDLILENGEVIQCVLGDVKMDCHTDDSNTFSRNGCMSEFIVAPKQLDATVKKQGDCSLLPSQNWNSLVKHVRVYEVNVLNI